jgi:sialic acid synthase SpsE
MADLKIGKRTVGLRHPVYFVADISANHDGSLDRAKTLVKLAADAGADAAKFQNFRAAKIVSDYGFRNLGQVSHQAKWKKSVFEVYKGASIPWDWTEPLKRECDAVGIDYFSTPYDLEAVDMLDPYVEVFKIGSGDITWPEMLRKVASKQKPILLAAGASDIGEVQRAVNIITVENNQLSLMQCNTNYTGSLENFSHIHLNVLKTFQTMFPDLVLGLSDHTPGHATVLGAVTLGARTIEKHFTDDTTREGPDHPFSMDPRTWREMVARSRELERALGDSRKQVADNERDTVVVQRRSVRAARDLAAGTVLTREMLDVLRPAPVGSIPPHDIEKLLGRRLRHSLLFGQTLSWSSVEDLATNASPAQ